jgi:signal transduction histidine kinase
MGQVLVSTREERALRELETAALHTDLRALRAALAGPFRDMTACQSISLLTHSADRDVYDDPPQNGDASPGPELKFRAQGSLVQWLEANEEGLPIPDDFGVFEYLDTDERDVLSARHVRLCLPLIGTEGLVGILLFADERAGWQVPGADRPLLRRCAERAALALEGADRHQVGHTRLRSLHRADQLVVAGQMAAAVAHEVRNPLQTIRSTIQYVMTSSSDWPHKLDLLEQTLEEVDRIDHTLSGMLSLSRPPILAMIEVDLVSVFRDALKAIRPSVQDRRVEIQADLGQPLLVIGDVGELRQVFVNLLLNACQSVPPSGRVVVTAGVERETAATRYAAIRIADDGPGIAPEHMERIFDPFFTTKKGGTGLGLPVCLEIVSRHGGRLDITCPVHGGTVVSVLLPMTPNTHGHHSDS